MKRIVLIMIIGFLVSFKNHNQPFIQTINIPKQLVGEWEFIKLIDGKGNKVDTIWKDGGGKEFEVVNRADIIFDKQGRYIKTFTPTKKDIGKWEYDDSNKSIVFYLLVDPNNYMGKYLIDNGLAIKQGDGNYYQSIKENLFSIDDEKLIIIESPIHKKVYHKKI